MERVVAWLIEHWPEALSALASVATLGVLLREKGQKDLPLDVQITVHRDRETGLFLARVLIQRPNFGLAEVEQISAKGWDIAPRLSEGPGYDPTYPPPEQWLSKFAPGWHVDMHGEHHSALFWFWATPRSSIRSRTNHNVMRLKLRISLKSARSLTKTITATSNTID